MASPLAAILEEGGNTVKATRSPGAPVSAGAKPLAATATPREDTSTEEPRMRGGEAP